MIFNALTDIAPRSSRIAGNGMFANERIAAGQVICHFGGEDVSTMGCLWRIATRRARADDPLHIGRHRYLILDPMSLMFNHSCGPNAAIRGSVELVALRDIEPDVEITYDYSLTVPDTMLTHWWGMDCACGASECRGHIGNISTAAQPVLKAYLEKNALQDHVIPFAARRTALSAGENLMSIAR